MLWCWRVMVWINVVGKKPRNPEAAVWRIKWITWNLSRSHIIRKDPHINKLDLEKQIFQWYTYSHTHKHTVACCFRIIATIILLDSIRNIILQTGSKLPPSKPVSSHTLFPWQVLGFLALEPKQISVDFGWQCWCVCGLHECLCGLECTMGLLRQRRVWLFLYRGARHFKSTCNCKVWEKLVEENPITTKH